MPPLRVPPRYVIGLQTVSRLSAEDLRRIAAACGDLGAGADLDSLIAEIQSQFPDDIGVRKVIEAVISLIGLLPDTGEGAAELAVDVSESQSLELGTADREPFVGRLLELMDAPALRLAARAKQLSVEFDKVLHDARIVTDLRPIFDRDVASGPQAAMIDASLKLEFHKGGDGPLESVYLAVGRSDLEHLRRLIDRSLTKMDQLQALVEAAKLPVWNGETHRHGPV